MREKKVFIKGVKSVECLVEVDIEAYHLDVKGPEAPLSAHLERADTALRIS